MWLLRLLAYLPLWILYRLSDVIYLFICYISPYRQKEVVQHLQRAFPDKSATDITALKKAFYRNIADILVESIKAIRLPKASFKQRVTFKNSDILQPYIAQKQSILLTAAHQCNWEWLLLGGCVNLPYPLDAVYKPLHYTPADSLMYEIRAKFGAKPIAVKQTIMQIMQRRQEMRCFALVADQSPVIDEEKYWATFLGQDTAFAVGTEKLARLTKYPVFFAHMRRIKRGYYEVELELLAQPPYEKEGYAITQAYADAVERQIQAHPADWLWSYRKWKYKKSVYEN